MKSSRAETRSCDTYALLRGNPISTRLSISDDMFLFYSYYFHGVKITKIAYCSSPCNNHQAVQHRKRGYQATAAPRGTGDDIGDFDTLLSQSNLEVLVRELCSYRNDAMTDLNSPRRWWKSLPWINYQLVPNRQPATRAAMNENARARRREERTAGSPRGVRRVEKKQNRQTEWTGAKSGNCRIRHPHQTLNWILFRIYF